MPLTPFPGTLGRKRAAHLLRRSTYGPSRAQIDQFSNLTVGQAIAILFDQTLPDPELPVDLATGTEWVESGTTDANSDERTLQKYFKSWFLGQMLSSGVPLNQSASYSAREKITFFYHTLFTTIQSKVNNSRSIYFQNALFRLYSFDDNGDLDFNFKSLSKKICVDNAMLRFLDGDSNVAGSPNENFGREFLELYSIGRGLEGSLPPLPIQGDYFNFTEQDVQAAARVFSGFRLDNDFANMDPDTGLPRSIFRGPASHDNDPKEFSDRFNNVTIQADPLLLLNGEATEESILDEIDQFIEMIYSQSNEAARNICRKLYRFYVYYEIDENLDNTIINDMAQTLIANNYKIQPVLEELFSSQHFYDAAPGTADNNFGGIIKSPMDLVLGTLRFFEVPVPSYNTDLENFYIFTENILDSMQEQGMDLYEPFEVAGYSAYHQFPIYNRNWISTNYLTRRYEFIENVISNMDMNEPGSLSVDLFNYSKNNFGVIGTNARNLIIEYCQYLLPVNDNLTYDPNADDSSEITAERLNYFLVALLFSPQIDADPEGSWSFRWNNPVDNEVVTNQLESLLNGMLQTPEYQLF